MTKTLEVFRFELGYQLRRRSTPLYFLILLVISVAFMQMLAGGPRDDGDANSPFSVLVMAVFGSMLGLAVIAALAGNAAARDADTRIDSLFYTSAVGKRAYLLGRFLGAFCVSALIFLALPAGSLLSAWMPWTETEGGAALRASTYLMPYFAYVLPNAFTGTALLFAAAVLTRRAMASYAAAAFLFFGTVISGKLLGSRLGFDVARLLDPLGFATITELLQSLSPHQKNTFVLALDGAFLANRLLWIGVTTIAVAAAYTRLRFAHHAVSHRRTTTKETEGESVAVRGSVVPTARRVFDTSTRTRQLASITLRSFRELHTSRVWLIVPLLAVIFILEAPGLARNEMGIPGPLTTARLVGFLIGDVSLLVTLLIALSAGELVWRERDARIHALTGVTPVPDWISVTGRFFGLALMLAATLTIFMLAGIAVQTIFGTERYDLALYGRLLFGLLLPDYLLVAAVAMIIHVLVNQKYVANVLVVLLPAATHFARRFGVDDLLLYGDLPPWMYSEISGFGAGIKARLWFTLYFGGWALLFALITNLFWIRGEELSLRRRIAIARRRLTGRAAVIAAIAVVTITGAGAFIFYNTHVVSEKPGIAETELRRAEFEQRYGRHASLPQPSVAATKLHIDFYPRRGTATVRGGYRLENRSRTRIETIHVATSHGARATSVSFDRGSRVAVNDDRLEYRIYALDRPLEPGESLQMHFGVDIRTNPFQSYGTAPVVHNGSILINRPRNGDHWLPLVGYQSSRELDAPEARKKYGLRERSRFPRLGDVEVGTEQRGYEKITLETIIGTEVGQMGVAPGETRRSWVENGRQYVHYLTDAPISDAWTITSAKYAVHRSKWQPSGGSGQPVDIEIFHHPTHTANLGQMARGARASLEYNSSRFGPYPHRQLRLVEFPGPPDQVGMTAHDGLITYAEGFSLIRSGDDPRKIDFPFAVVSHEVGHQWWGHQLTPAIVEGAPLLTESLAWYSGMLVIEETLGREHLHRFLDMFRANYLAPHQPRAVPLLRAVDSLDGYRRGPFAMYATGEAIGVDKLNGALRNLLAKFPPGRAPFPTSLDFYAELRAATPPPRHSLLKDLFEEITFWELRAKSMHVKKLDNGSYRVILDVDATKLKGDGTGGEQPVPMNDPIEIMVYDGDGKSLYRATHLLRSGAQTIEIVVPRPPAGAAVDPDHELLDRNPEDNDVAVERTAFL